MDTISTTGAAALAGASTGGITTRTGVSELNSDEFLRLLITELTNQDPLEPMENQDLLNQISSIRDIEMSTTMTDALKSLTGQQHVASVTSLIGKYITSQPDEDGFVDEGVVTAVRFDESGNAWLQLEDGTELTIDRVATVEGAGPLDAETQAAIAAATTGKSILPGTAARPGVPAPLNAGQLTGLGLAPTGAVTMQLDNGSAVPVVDVISQIGLIGQELSRVF